MKIINIIETNRGIVTELISYPIYFEHMTDAVIGKVNEDFASRIKTKLSKHNIEFDDEQIQGYVTDRWFTYSNNYYVEIVSSTEVIKY